MNTITKIFIILVILILLSYFLRNSKVISSGNLEKDGFCVIKNILTNDDICNIENYLNSDKITDTKKYITLNERINNLIKSNIFSILNK